MKTLRDVLRLTDDAEVADRALAIVERDSGMPRALFLVKCRRECLVSLRECAYRLASVAGMTQEQIAEEFGAKRPAVSHSLLRVAEKKSVDPDYKEVMERLEREMLAPRENKT